MERIAEIGKQHEPSAAAIGHSRNAAPSSASLSPALQLQQMVGNQAMQEFLRSGYIQAKLAISNPDDPEEREADQVAYTIMRKAAGVPSSSPCSCSGEGEMCEECQQKQFQPTISRRATAPSAPSHAPRIVSDVLRSPGHPLDSAARAFFEPRFGHDFSHVRVHTDSPAVESARSINAHAYAAGPHIAFDSGQYAPESTSGRTLLAHELTHVLHQTALGTSPSVQRKTKEAAPDQPVIFQLRGDDLGLLAPRAGGIGGPLPAGTVREDNGLTVHQITDQHVVIEYANSRIEVSVDPGGTYSYFIDDAKPQTPEPRPLFLLPELEEKPKRPVQRVVRFAANSFSKVHVERPYDPEGGNPVLVLHEAYGGPLSTSPGWTGEIEEWWISATSVQLRVDSSVVKITTPNDDPSLRAEDYPGARFAYSFAPEWEGTLGLEKRVFIVASPGVRLLQGTGEYSRGVEYGRKLIPVMIRVSHPGLVPQQGTTINPGDFVGAENVGETPVSMWGFSQEPTDAQKHRLLTVSKGLSGVTVSHPWSGSHVSLRPIDPSIGAVFAWQVLPPRNESFGEIRVVVGPGTFVEFAEPVPSRLRRSGGPVTPPLAGTYQVGEALEEERVTLRVVEVDQNSEVPVPGTPLNIDYYLGRGKLRDPDAHQWLGIDETAMIVSDFLIRLIPVVGELYSIGEFYHAVRYGENFMGQKVNSGEIILMGAGIVIGLIPYVGAGIGTASRLAKAASTLGKTAEELEATVVTLSQVASEQEQAVLTRGARALEEGTEISEEELPKLEAALSHVAPGVALRQAGVDLKTARLVLSAEELAQKPLESPGFAVKIAKEFEQTGEINPAVELALERSGGVSSSEEATAALKQSLRDAARDPASGINAKTVDAVTVRLDQMAEEGQFQWVEQQPGRRPVSMSGRMKEPRELRTSPVKVTRGKTTIEHPDLEPTPELTERIKDSEQALGDAYRSVGEPVIEREKTFAASQHGVTVSGYTFVPENEAVAVAPERVAQHAEEIGHRLRGNPADMGGGKGFHGKYYASHAEKKQIVANPNHPVGVNRPMCPDCMRFFAEEARFRNRPQIVTDPFTTRVFSPDGTLTEYWRDGSRLRIDPDGLVSVTPGSG
jgi:hypothetical protein